MYKTTDKVQRKAPLQLKTRTVLERGQEIPDHLTSPPTSVTSDSLNQVPAHHLNAYANADLRMGRTNHHQKFMP